MGRWDSADNSPDDWKGWKDGNYDNRYGGGRNSGYYGGSWRRTYSRSKKKSVIIIFSIIVLIGIGFFYGVYSQNFKLIPFNDEKQTPSSKTNNEYVLTSTTVTGCTMTSNGLGDIILNCSGKNYDCKSNSPVKSAIQKSGITQDVTLRVSDDICQVEYVDNIGNTIIKSFTLVSENTGLNFAKQKKIQENDDVSQIHTSDKLQIPKVTHQPSNTVNSQQTTENRSIPRDELITYALKRINEDRERNNLPPVLLSTNQAAQIHSDDVFAQRSISHWMSNGEKPYMTYTRYGGFGSVSQNVAVFECRGYVCNADPISQIDDSEYGMIYNDAASGWGHKDNILRPYHTHVSIGISYDDNFFVMVQNFEDNYLLSENPIQVNNGYVQIRGELKSGNVHNINIFYDPLPSTTLYGQHRNDRSYGLGDSIAVVAPPLGPNSYYEEPTDYKLIVADTMTSGKLAFIDFDMSQIMTQPGVYTIGVWLKDGGKDFLITNYSVLNE